MVVLSETHSFLTKKNAERRVVKPVFQITKKLQYLKYKATKHEINCHEKLKYHPSRAPIVCAEKNDTDKWFWLMQL